MGRGLSGDGLTVPRRWSRRSRRAWRSRWKGRTGPWQGGKLAGSGWPGPRRDGRTSRWGRRHPWRSGRSRRWGRDRPWRDVGFGAGLSPRLRRNGGIRTRRGLRGAGPWGGEVVLGVGEPVVGSTAVAGNRPWLGCPGRRLRPRRGVVGLLVTCEIGLRHVRRRLAETRRRRRRCGRTFGFAFVLGPGFLATHMSKRSDSQRSSCGYGRSQPYRPLVLR
ncbi:hypothetical protein FHR32_003925 [Streptosporangium album]|uniref:Uncharacterized protein n=1 Tax=Streptosporangium album TaxID=47479 RepID=A0A7W7RWV6_9ACTN|nr:hypothetical protein [Streptosporangium album]